MNSQVTTKAKWRYVDDLGREWRRAWDDNSERWYYYVKRTNFRSWSDPSKKKKVPTKIAPQAADPAKEPAEEAAEEPAEEAVKEPAEEAAAEPTEEAAEEAAEERR